jgi:hypothetical protein
MADNDTEVQTDLRDSEVQQSGWVENSPVPVRSALRASNTNATLAPKSIFDSSNVLEIPESVVEQIAAFKPKEVVYGPPKVAPEVKKTEVVYSVPANSIPQRVPRFSSIGALVDNKPTVSAAHKTDGDRIQRLEEQMDSLLDRLARYNAKSSHKI